MIAKEVGETGCNNVPRTNVPVFKVTPRRHVVPTGTSQSLVQADKAATDGGLAVLGQHLIRHELVCFDGLQGEGGGHQHHRQYHRVIYSLIVYL